MFILRQRRLQLIILILTTIMLIVVGLVHGFGLVTELDLNKSDDGLAFELYRDKNGHLWISEFGAGEIWQIDPILEEYTVYGNLTGASDVKVDGDGDIWWNNYLDNELGRYTPGESSAEVWSLTGDISQTLGLAIDPNDDIWTTDELAPIVHRFHPATNEMCAYEVPDDGASSYIVADSGQLWLGDWINNRILSLDPVENEFDIWQLPDSNASNIFGLAVDENHDVWWADQNQNFLGRLTPQQNQVTTYTLPGQSWFAPTIVSAGQSKVWTTSGSLDFIARLNPDKVNLQPSTIVSSTTVVIPVCDSPVNPKNLPVSIDGPNDFQWGGGFYNQVTTPDSNVWLVYQIGYLDTTIGSPWGIVATGQEVFIVDQGRQELIRLKPCYQLSLTHTGSGEDPLSSADPSGICPQGEHLSGAVVSLTARPAAGLGVLNWTNTDDDSSTGLNNSVTMPDVNHTITVTYGVINQDCYQLTLAHTGNGQDPLASPDHSGNCPDGEYFSGELVTLTARPAAGYGVLFWTNTDDDSDIGLTNSITMPSGKHTVTVRYGAGTFLPLVQRN